MEGNASSGLAVFRGLVRVEDTVFSGNSGSEVFVSRYSTGFFLNFFLDATSPARTALIVNSYSSVSVRGESSLEGSTSVFAWNGSIVDIRGLGGDPIVLEGRININYKSRVFLSWVEQVVSGSFSRNNIGNDSFLETNRSGLVTLGGTRIHHSSYADLHNVDFGSSDVSLDRFATATLQDTTLRLLSCSQGADAHCSEFDGSLEAYATSSCGQCPDRCGNGNEDAGEECDDNNLNGGDGCAPSCTFEICGNFIFDTGEECDDGNLDDGDGCSSICEVEP